MAERVPLDAQNPWPGLAAYVEDDRAYFLGRDAEADELTRLVRRERLTVLFGRSGLGKSSLLSAGLFPRLRHDLHLPVLLRIGYGAKTTPRQQIWEGLAHACAAADVRAPPPDPDEAPWAYFHRAGAGFWNVRRRPLLPVLVFDQFEELFTLGQETEASRRAVQGFIDELADLVEDRPSDDLRRKIDDDPALGERLDFERRGCKVLLSFREDFLADVEGLRDRMPSLMRNRFRLLPMNGAQARQVVSSGGDLVSADVGERIIGLAWRNKAEAPLTNESSRVEIDPALLSVICSELNRRRVAAKATAIEPGLLAGAEREILTDFYERSLAGLQPEVRHFVEDHLVSATGYRANYGYNDALKLAGVSRDALSELVERRLLRLDDRFGQRQLELTHDVLTRVALESRERRRERATQERDRQRNREAELAVKSREAAAAAAQQRNRRVFAFVMSGAVLALGLLAWAGWQTSQATVAKEEAAVARTQAADSAKAAKAQQDDADRSKVEAARKDTEARAAQSRASAAEAAASGALIAAEAERKRANDQLREADHLKALAWSGQWLAVADRLPTGEFDRALLVKTEALRNTPDHPDALGAVLAWLHDRSRPSGFLRGHAGPVGHAVFSPDGTRLASSGKDGRVILWDGESRKVLAILKGHDGPVYRVAFSPDGRLLASSGEDKTVILWDVQSHKPLAKLEGHGVLVSSIAFSPDGRRLASASYLDSSVILWDVQSRKTLMTLKASGVGVGSLAFSPDGRVLAAVSDRVVIFWDTESNTEIAPIMEFKGNVYGIAFSPDGTRLATALEAEPVTIWDLKSRRVLAAFGAPDRRLNSVAFSPDGRWLATAGSGVALWDTRADQYSRASPAVTLRGHFGPFYSVAFSSDGARLVSAGDDETVLLWDIERHNLLTTLEGHETQVNAVAFSPDGRQLASGSWYATVLLWDVENGKELAELKGHNSSVYGVAFSPDGKRLASASKDSTVIVWDVRGRKALATFRGHTESVHTVAFSPDGKRLASGSADNSVMLWDVQGGKTPATLRGHKNTVTSVAFSPDGKLLASASKDDSVVVWDVQSRRPLVTLEGHTDSVLGVAFSPDGKRLASASEDRTIRLWDVASGKVIARLTGLHEPAHGVAFSADGKHLATAFDNGKVSIWGAESHKILATLDQHRERATSVAFSPNGLRLASGSWDKTVILWDLDPAHLTDAACRTAGRNLTCSEWRESIGPDVPYRATCRAFPLPPESCK